MRRHSLFAWTASHSHSLPHSFTQALSSFIGCKNVVDLTRNGKPAHGENGTYSGYIYAGNVCDTTGHVSTPPARTTSSRSQLPTSPRLHWLLAVCPEAGAVCLCIAC